jgi:hypothetical protein
MKKLFEDEIAKQFPTERRVFKFFRIGDRKKNIICGKKRTWCYQILPFQIYTNVHMIRPMVLQNALSDDYTKVSI